MSKYENVEAFFFDISKDYNTMGGALFYSETNEYKNMYLTCLKNYANDYIRAYGQLDVKQLGKIIGIPPVNLVHPYDMHIYENYGWKKEREDYVDFKVVVDPFLEITRIIVTAKTLF